MGLGMNRKLWTGALMPLVITSSSAFAQADQQGAEDPGAAAAEVTEEGAGAWGAPIVDEVAAPEQTEVPPEVGPSAEDEPEAAPKKAPSANALGEIRLLQIAVYDLEMADDVRLGRLLTDQLVVEIRKLGGASVIGMTEIKAMLDHEAAKAMTGCEEDESCLADIAGALGVDVIVIGSVAKVGNEHVVGMRRIDQRNAKVAGQYQQRITDDGTGQALMAAIGAAVEEMFGDMPLKEGQSRGVSDAVLYRLDPPPLPAWVFWSSAVGSGALLAAAASLALLNGGAWLLHTGYYASGATAPLQYTQVQQNRLIVDVTAYAAIGALVLGLVGATGTGVMALFTDFVGTQPGEEG